jgi:hypothetical protein
MRSIRQPVFVALLVTALLGCARREASSRGATAVLKDRGTSSGIATTPRSLASSQPPSAAQMSAIFDTILDHDAPDPTWTSDAQRSAVMRLTSLLPPGSTLQSVACRTTFCRIETRHSGSVEFQRFFRSAFLDSSLWNAEVYSSVQHFPATGSSIIGVTYLARPGQSLPKTLRY